MDPFPFPLRAALTLLIPVMLTACEGGRTSAPDPPASPVFESIAFAPHPAAFPAPPPASSWRLLDAGGDTLATVRLLTHWTPEGFQWRWEPPLPRVQDQDRFLVPLNRSRMHSLRIPAGEAPGPPLPVQAVESEAYPNVLALLQELTEPWFGQVVVHWPERPIPVRCGEAVAGLVDLSACLAEAAGVWNDGEPEPWFRVDEDATWGVRLVHLPDRRLSPPLSIRITRLDSTRSPLRMNLLAGNNYDQLHEPRYAVRGFVHELGHALFLWGHSRDRIHCLWGAAPPIVDQPSQDERKAARLWHGLPVGLDLSLYE